MQGLESCAAQLEILPEVMKPLIGQGIAFQAGLGAIPAFGVREDPAAEAGRRRRAEQDLEGGILYIAQKVVDDGTGIQLSGAADEQIVESR